MKGIMKITDEFNKLPLVSGKKFQKMDDGDDFFIPRESREFTGAMLTKNGDATYTLSVGNFSEATGTLEELKQKFNFSI